MEWIERYLQEVGRSLPRKQRADILGEMRSALSDALEDQAGPNPTQAQVFDLLRSYGEPSQVAARYYPEGQYLVGPGLYPLFRLVASIAIAAVAGAQVLAWLAVVFIAGDAMNPLETLAGLLNSLPSALGWVVIVFIILQRFDVRGSASTGLGEQPWDPATLPPLNRQNEVNRGEQVIGVIFQAIFLAILVAFSDRLGAFVYPGGQFFANPILPAYLPWIYLSLLAGIGLDVYLLWQGRWATASRLVQLALNLYAIVLLSILAQAHLAWLQAHGAGNFLASLESLQTDINASGQIMSVQAFLIAFAIGLVVTLIETVATLYRLIRQQFDK